MQSRRRGWATLCGVAVLLVGALFVLPTVMHFYGLANEVSLPLLAIAGVVVLLGALALVSIAFKMMDMADPQEALALPAGSIRAVIALSLVVLFAILTVFLFSSLDSGGRVQKLTCLSAAESDTFLRNLGPQQVLLTIESAASEKGEPCRRRAAATSSATPPTSAAEPAAGANGPSPAASSGTPPSPPPTPSPDASATSAPAGTQPPASLFTVYHRDTIDPASQDFAKQLLVLIGTLVTAVASFYFGAKAVSDAQAATAPDVPPSLVGVNPAEVQVGGELNPLHITGSNLNSIEHAQLVYGPTQIVGIRVVSNPTEVQARFQIPTTVPADSIGKQWDVVVIDAVGRTARLPAALHVTAGAPGAATGAS
jgi:hypothetical protein